MTTKNKLIKISNKGQITLPKAFLDKMNIQAGEFINISYNQQTIQITNPKIIINQKLQKIAGSVKPKIPTSKNLDEQINEAVNDHYQSKRF